MSTPEKPTGPTSYFPSIEQKYGKPIAHWLDLLDSIATSHFVGRVSRSSWGGTVKRPNAVNFQPPKTSLSVNSLPPMLPTPIHLNLSLLIQQNCSS